MDSLKMQKDKILQYFKEKGFDYSLINDLQGDASTRQYFRLFDEKKSHIACLDPNLTSTEVDQFFVYELLKKNKVNVPDLIYKELKDNILLWEDAGEMPLLKDTSNSNDLKKEKLYKAVIDELVKIHQIEPEPQSYMANFSFTKEKFFSELEISHKYFLLKTLNIGKKNEKELLEEYNDLSAALLDYPKVVTHRDFHSKNIMIKNDRPYVIDFQDARMGPRAYDLCSLLHDCYAIIDERLRSSLLEYYYSKFGAEVRNEVLESYDIILVQRLYKALGTFAYQYHEKGKIGYLFYVSKVVNDLRTALMRSGVAPKLFQALEKSYD